MRLKLICLALNLVFFISNALAEAPNFSICQTSEKTFTQPQDLVIKDNATVTSTLLVQGVNFLGEAGIIWDIDLKTFISHSRPGDLDITLTSPAGTVVTITTDNGGGNDDVFNGTLWDDSANPAGLVPYTSNNGLVTDHSYLNGVLASPLVPEEGLIAFKNENPNGLWTLTIVDDFTGETGFLSSWSLVVTALPSMVGFGGSGFTTFVNQAIPDGNKLVSTRTQPTAKICAMSVRLDISHPNPADLDVTLTSPLGKTVTLTTDNGLTFDDVFTDVRFGSIADLGSPVPYSVNPNIVTDHVYSAGDTPTFLTPEESLAIFYGDEGAGQWTLTVSDDSANGLAGTLNSWEIGYSECPIVNNADNDGDGFTHACDLCDSDPNKVNPGQCGCNKTDIDFDQDGVANCNDLCPFNVIKTDPGICGCTVSDVDSDLDGLPDCQDQCPQDKDKTAPGICGCGVSDFNADGDSVPNCQDLCPNDSAKAAPGSCGCGLADTDSDGDGKPDCLDGCPQDVLKIAAGTCGCGVSDVDTDKDGLVDCLDFCPLDTGKTSAGICGCGTSDADSNSNGVIDCKVNAELRARVAKATAIISKLKVKTKGKARKVSKALTNSAIKDIADFVNSGTLFKLSDANINLGSFQAALKKSVKNTLKFKKETFGKSKKAATKNLNSISASVVPEA
jgi:subtilisin-like proprotein convertase family protein